MEDPKPSTPDNSKAVDYQPSNEFPGELSRAHGGYSHDSEAKTFNPGWMENIPGEVKISELSMPGTHDSMSFYGGDAVQCQTMSLENQLESGIRVLDIRCRHIEDIFAIHHGIVFQKTYFGDVLNTAVDFLERNPTESILIRVKEEYEPKGNTRTFEETFRDGYWNTYKKFCWQPSSDNPTLEEIRGKIVILQDFSSAQKFGVNYATFSIQDEYHLTTNWDLYQKWEDVKSHLKITNQGEKSTKYINYLSGSGGSFPYFVASGHSSPGTSAPRLATGRTTPGWKDSWPDFPRVNCFIGICTIAFEGTNILTTKWLEHNFKNCTGIIMSDFPGPDLIDAVIKRNDRFVE
jgi:1-phosphatidylinositol phosphodiesterase